MGGCSAVSAAGHTRGPPYVRQWTWGQLKARCGLLLASSLLAHVFSLSLLLHVAPQALAIPNTGLGNEVLLGLASGERRNSLPSWEPRGAGCASAGCLGTSRFWPCPGWADPVSVEVPQVLPSNLVLVVVGPAFHITLLLYPHNKVQGIKAIYR